MTPEQTATVFSAAAAFIGAIAAVGSAILAGLAVRAQRAAQHPHVRVSHTTVVPTFGLPGMPGAHVGEPHFGITVNNDGILPVTVMSAGIAFRDGSVPFIGSATPGGVNLPKRLESGEEVTLVLDEMRRVARTHLEDGPALFARASIGAGAEFRGPKIKGAWLASWAQ